ncbi:MAG: HAD family hydrolase [Cyanobacteriota bacterium]|jgi:phosphoglycolate phosphatase
MAHLLLRGEALVSFGGPSHKGQPCDLDVVLFDKDGTMSHSEPMLLALAQARVFHCLELAAGRGVPQAESLRDLLERAYGLGTNGLHPAGTIAVAAREHNLISTATALAQVGMGWPEALALAEEVFDHTDRLHGEGSEHRPQPTEGLLPMLERLRASGLRCAVISNDHEEGIRMFLASHGLEAQFDGLWSAEHRPRKPDPAAVHGLCAELGVDPQRCALIGDANSDLRMARAAGVGVVLGYPSGWQHPAPLDPAFPQVLHWSELEARPAQGT